MNTNDRRTITYTANGVVATLIPGKHLPNLVVLRKDSDAWRVARVEVDPSATKNSLNPQQRRNLAHQLLKIAENLLQ